MRSASGNREGLTLSQLEQMVLSGEAGADDEVCHGGTWVRVSSVPYLRRMLRARSAPAPIPASPAGEGGPLPSIPLVPGPDGKLRPDDAVVLAMLRAGSDRSRMERTRLVGRVVTALAALLLAGELLHMLKTILFPPVR